MNDIGSVFYQYQNDFYALELYDFKVLLYYTWWDVDCVVNFENDPLMFNYVVFSISVRITEKKINAITHFVTLNILSYDKKG